MPTEIKFNSNQRLLRGLLTLVTVLFLLPSFSQAQDSCFVMIDSKLAYVDPHTFETVYLTVQGNNHVEYHNNGEYFIHSSLRWINECEYESTLVESTLPGFTDNVGRVMKVRIELVKDGVIYCQSQVGELFWQSKLFILDEIPEGVKMLED
ncbi:MAG: hypothetical protein ACI837_002022 [Crocinitomicaceae bacterium]|jgi:hypothetical protein